MSTGFYDNATLRTVSKVCTGNSATCSTGSQFSQAASATNAGVASTLLGTDIWYLLSSSCRRHSDHLPSSIPEWSSIKRQWYFEVEQAAGKLGDRRGEQGP